MQQKLGNKKVINSDLKDIPEEALDSGRKMNEDTMLID